MWSWAALAAAAAMTAAFTVQTQQKQQISGANFPHKGKTGTGVQTAGSFFAEGVHRAEWSAGEKSGREVSQ